MRYWLAILCFVITSVCFSQTAKESTIDTTLQAIQDVPSKSLDYIDKKYTKLTSDIQSQSTKVLKRMQQQEDKLQRKLQGIDSTKAKALFETSKSKYAELQEKIQSPVNTATAKLKEYIPGLDSTNTALKFLLQPGNALLDDKLSKLSSLSDNVQELQGRLQQANEIQSFIREREAQLKEALANTPLGKHLLSINKEVYYYQERMREYKSLLNDRKKLEEKLFVTIRDLPAFQKFMEKYSFLSQLYRLPDNYGTFAGLAGLQTRSNIQGMIASRLAGGGAGGTNPQQYVQSQVQQAQSQISLLKQKLNKFGGVSSDMTMPDFKPNDQKTKKFLQRIEYGFNIQSSHSTFLLPATSDIAVTAGYKLTDKISFGTGLSYKLGWGDGWKNIKLSSQGIGLRSYVDIKAKGSIWISGGFEYNYMQAFSKIEEIKNIDVWQRSALAGFTKKIIISKKRESKIQLLYDFLATKQIPRAQAFKFRIGYNF